MRRKGDTGDAAVARIAAQQYGVASIGQLRAAGLSETAVRRRVHAGRLHRLHRGVYAVGHIGLSHRSRWMAAVLTYGDGAAISHRSAAALWRLLPPRSEPIDVSLPGTAGRKQQEGIRLHRSRTLTPTQTTRRFGIPVTTPARTITDLRRVSAESEVRRAIRQAGVLGLHLPEEMPGDPTRSELEQAFLRLCKRHDLPAPEVNIRLSGFEVDFLWRSHRLIVETDGYRYHRGRAAFEDDRDRDLHLRSLGYDVVRLTYRQVIDEPDRVAATLRMSFTTPDSTDPTSPA